MLEELHLQNLVIFPQCSLPFTAGLNVISGETGAGKSLIALALGLALGARANTEMISSGSNGAEIKAVFSLPTETAILSLLRDYGVIVDNAETLIFARQLRSGQSSRLSLNDAPISANSARQIADNLLDLSAQNEHTRLFDAAYQRELLDAYGKIDDQNYQEIFAGASAIVQRLNAGDEKKNAIKVELDRLRYQLKKIDDFAFVAENDLSLEQKIAALSHTEQITATATQGVEMLYESEDAISDKLATLIKQCSAIEKYSAEIGSVGETLQNAQNAISDAVRQLQAIQQNELDADDIDALVKRSEELKNLLRLIDGTGGASELPEVEKKLRAREQELANWEFDDISARKELKKLSAQLLTLGMELQQKRETVAKKLSTHINRELRDLEMAHANFSVQFTPLFTEKNRDDVMQYANTGGLYEIDFLIAPNVGEPAAKLSATASGGEMARTMLAIKSALATTQMAITLFFDEIDAGVGGRLGDVLGKKLRQLSSARQIIVITHLPQIAAYAQQHLRVTKTTNKNQRTVAKIETLNDEQRLDEIAQMINGNAATAITRQQAKEMLARAEA